LLVNNPRVPDLTRDVKRRDIYYNSVALIAGFFLVHKIHENHVYYHDSGGYCFKSTGRQRRKLESKFQQLSVHYLWIFGSGYGGMEACLRIGQIRTAHGMPE
jgi:hypothetical protein